MRKTGLGRVGVYLSELPTRNRMAPRPGMPDFYRADLQRQWREGRHAGRVLLAEIQTLGYIGCQLTSMPGINHVIIDALRDEPPV